MRRSLTDKIQTREVLAARCEMWRKEGKRVGFTSGAFDLLHAGHVDYLEEAKKLCDVLIVGVNTDASIRRYKGPDRPILSEQDRIRVVAALESVDYAFLFDERRNQKNIEALRPDLYIKAGDYSKETLTSGETVERYGGRVVLIPIRNPVSTTQIIEKIRGTNERIGTRFVEKEGTGHFDLRPLKKQIAVFVDRDGTIIEEALYLHDPNKVKLLPNAAEGLKRFQDLGYKIVILTNQPGIGIGYFPEEAFYAVNRELLKRLNRFGVLVNKIYFCPHSKADGCDCRKPGLALVKRAEEELNLDLPHCVIIGDKTSDIETGKRAGMKTILVETGFKGEDGEYPATPDARVPDLLAAAEWVLFNERGSGREG